MITGLVFDIKRFAVHDGPGIRTSVFLKGCPLVCRWCHNPESQSAQRERVYLEGRCIRCGACMEICDRKAISMVDGRVATDVEACILCGNCVEICCTGAREIAGREWTVEEVMEEIERDRSFYDESGGGVTFSGGEPLMQRDFLLSLLQSSVEREIHVALDTCGYASREVIDDIRGYVDLFLYDLKLVDDARHREFTGVSNEQILENLKHLSERGHRIRLRVPVIPGANDDDANIRGIGELAAGLPTLERLDVLPYHRAAVDKHERLNKFYPMSDARPLSDDRMLEIKRIFEEFGYPVKLGG